MAVSDAASGAALAEVLIGVETSDGLMRASGFTNAEGAITLRLREACTSIGQRVGW